MKRREFLNGAAHSFAGVLGFPAWTKAMAGSEEEIRIRDYFTWHDEY
jgi:hypothetical protein